MRRRCAARITRGKRLLCIQPQLPCVLHHVTITPTPKSTRVPTPTQPTNKPGQQYKVHCRRTVPAGAPPQTESDAPDESSTAEEVLLDENARKEEGRFEFYMLSAVDESPDQKLLAWAEDTVGGEKYTLHVKVRG